MGGLQYSRYKNKEKVKNSQSLVRISSVLISYKLLYTRPEEGLIQLLRVSEKVLKSSWKIIKCSLEWLSKVL